MISRPYSSVLLYQSAFPNRPSRSVYAGLLLVVIIALIGRILIIASNSISFHSDEAIVGLMARHILQGERPTFFYGQAYMGSLDAWLIALAFRLFGEGVFAIRIVQSVLYLGIVAASYWFAWQISRRLVIAVVAALTLAIPSVLFATYTSATLGGYGEVMLLGTLVLILGYALTHDHRRSAWRWAALGLSAGIGWWTNALIAIYAAPIALLILYDLIRSRRQLLPHLGFILISLIGFLIGSAPWWVYALQTDLAPLRFLLGGAAGDFAGTDVFSLPLNERLIGFFFLGLPTLWGMRFPWFPTYFGLPIGMLVAFVYILAAIQFMRKDRLASQGKLLIFVYVGLFCVVYLASRFSFDPTGRYFLPLALPLGIVLGVLIDSLWSHRKVLAVFTIALVLSYHALGLIATATTYPGFTTQFNLDTHIPNDDDAALIAWLDENDLTRGYTNYWVTFRLAFLSREQMQFSAAIPYLPSMIYTPFDERYPPYRHAADSAERIAYIFPYTNENVLPVQARLESIFAETEVQYQQAQVGVYTIYYDFDPVPPRPPLPFLP
jgi:4-amino-4-deoxy-L-arabinose transferase-like glycosyltransferase